MGHTHCGGIRAYSQHRNRLNPGDFIDSWMSLIAPAAKVLEDNGASADDLGRLEQASIVATMGNLMTFPWIKSRVESRELEVIGAYFDVGSGNLAIYDPAARVFAALGSGGSLPSMVWPAAE
jgi:carbonic anhydrase